MQSRRTSNRFIEGTSCGLRPPAARHLQCLGSWSFCVEERSRRNAEVVRYMQGNTSLRGSQSFTVGRAVRAAVVQARPCRHSVVSPRPDLPKVPQRMANRGSRREVTTHRAGAQWAVQQVGSLDEVQFHHLQVQQMLDLRARTFCCTRRSPAGRTRYRPRESSNVRRLSSGIEVEPARVNRLRSCRPSGARHRCAATRIQTARA